MAKKPEELKLYHYEQGQAIPEHIRKVLFPNVPPPTLKQLKQAKLDKLKKSE